MSSQLCSVAVWQRRVAPGARGFRFLGPLRQPPYYAERFSNVPNLLRLQCLVELQLPSFV